MEKMTGFIFLGSKITADGDCSHEIKRYLLLGRKAWTNLDSILKSRDLICQQMSIYSMLWADNLKMYKLDLEKSEEPEIKLSTSIGSSKKQESARKTSNSALLTIPKPLTMWVTTNSGKVLKRWEYQTTLPASWEICLQVKKQQLELDLEQQTGSKLGKE